MDSPIPALTDNNVVPGHSSQRLVFHSKRSNDSNDVSEDSMNINIGMDSQGDENGINRVILTASKRRRDEETSRSPKSKRVTRNSRVELEQEITNSLFAGAENAQKYVVTIEDMESCNQDPIRCLKCQKYGHQSKDCKSDYACWRCGVEYKGRGEHNPRECTRTMKCVNCNGDHTAGRYECTRHKKERSWAQTVYEEGISYEEAKGKYPDGRNTEAKRSNRSFADLNYKERLDILKNVLQIEWQNLLARKPEMKKFKRRDEKIYKVEVIVKSEQDMETLLSMKTLGGCKVKVTENVGKNTIQGIIVDREDELKKMSDDEIARAATHSGVRSVKRFGENGKVISINFKGQVLPERVTFWSELSFKVEPSIPPPTRCFKCQKYGHMSSSCRNSYACWNCSMSYPERKDHEPRECRNDRKCVNCEENHSAGSPVCKVHRQEKNWARIGFDQGISRIEAKNKYPDGKMPTFARVVADRNRAFGMDINPNFRREEHILEEEVPQNSQVASRLERIEAVLERHVFNNQENRTRDVRGENNIGSDMEKWRQEQERATQEIKGRMEQQEQKSKNLEDRVNSQNKIIHQMHGQLKEKDLRIKLLEEEREQLITTNEQMMVNSSLTMKNKIVALNHEVERLKQKKDPQQKKEGTSKGVPKDESSEMTKIKGQLLKSKEENRKLLIDNKNLQNTVADGFKKKK